MPSSTTGSCGAGRRGLAWRRGHATGGEESLICMILAIVTPCGEGGAPVGVSCPAPRGRGWRRRKTRLDPRVAKRPPSSPQRGKSSTSIPRSRVRMLPRARLQRLRTMRGIRKIRALERRALQPRSRQTQWAMRLETPRRSHRPSGRAAVQPRLTSPVCRSGAPVCLSIRVVTTRVRARVSLPSSRAGHGRRGLEGKRGVATHSRPTSPTVPASVGSEPTAPRSLLPPPAGWGCGPNERLGAPRRLR